MKTDGVSVLIRDLSVWSEIRAWLAAQVGEEGWFDGETWCLIHGERVRGGEWMWRHGDGAEHPDTYRFHFRNPSKAVLFALRWKGEV